ncbi:hypothetical protein BRD20_04315, partial [Halobacteriales archaeon SW_8_65_20]
GERTERQQALVEFAAAYSQATAGSADDIPEENIEQLFDQLLAVNPQAAEFVYRSEDGSYEALRLQFGVTGNARIDDIADDNREVAGVIESESGGESSGRPESGEPPHDAATTEELAEELRRLGVDATEQPDAGFGLVFYSDENAESLVDEVEGLRGNFEHYDTHLLTSVRAHAGRTAVVSLWKNERAANTASGFLGDLTGVGGDGIGGPLADRDAADHADTTTDDRDAAESPVEGTDDETDDDIRGELADLDIYAGQPHGEDVYAMVLYSAADTAELREEVDSLSDGFDRYDTHVGTDLYGGTATDRAAVVSLWDTRDAADTAGDYLADLPEIVGRAGEESTFGTMGMFYTVKPDYREAFVERFETVGGMLAELDGHIETDLMVNAADENDMFIASQWTEQEAALEFFRSDAFRDTVQWGRDVLADRPRHVFLA